MSSHHIVREKQEPALYIHHLGNFDEEYLGQLLEWSPTLIVNAAEYEKVISLGLKVDGVAGISDPLLFQENTRIINAVSNNLNEVVDHLISEKYPAVNIIDIQNSLPDLIDALSKIDIVVFTESEKAYAIRTGFKVWKPAGNLFSIQPNTDFKGSNLIPSQNGQHQVIADGFVEFIFNTPYLLISEPL
ncbi:thiamine pyrophosphokinase [Pedobacter sp. PWIIR3]